VTLIRPLNKDQGNSKTQPTVSKCWRRKL